MQLKRLGIMQRLLRKVPVYLKCLNKNKQKIGVRFISSSIPEDRVIFSGIQPTGVPHIGNYLGAIKYWVSLQQEPGKIFYSIVDLHSITIPRERDSLHCHILDMAACLLACGIDPEHSVLFQQSDIPEHTLLSWAIGCVVPVNRLKILPQWQERMKQSKDGGHIGTFTYPVLQSADILLYKATHIPVGEDQLIHINLTNELAQVMNRRLLKPFFPRVHSISTSTSTRIRNLRDPSVKMSKSAYSEQTRIELTDSDDHIWRKIRRSVTDCTSEIAYDPENRPGVSNLIEIHCGFSNLTPDEVCADAKGLDTGQYKRVVADAVITVLAPLRQRFHRLRNDEGHLKSVLKNGADRAREVAVANWECVRRLLGLCA
ncbi:tryptophan--tRNA ligase, mitochondrial-like isoform X1 [Clavelina lepadiformis]|uniref:tryptophan--tRNA ligase, mitochondrial-like isoform X1 n=1 Tax=Clavelina lepadiformis TaxID=159417 RepID=UPI00404124CD